MKRNKTPLYQEVEKEEVEKEEVIRKPDVDYTFTGGKYQGSILSKSSEGNLSFKKDGGIIHLDPNSSSAKFLLKQQKHEQAVAHARQSMLDSGEEEEFFHEPDSRVVKGPDTF